jgi:hypothetical protein
MATQPREIHTMDDLTATFDAHVEPMSTAEHVEALTPVPLMQISRLSPSRGCGTPGGNALTTAQVLRRGRG